MGLYKRGRYWHFDFVYHGQRHQGSTGQTNKNKATLAEAALRSQAALEHLGIAPPKQTPIFKDFLEGRFLAHVRQHNAAKPRTVLFYSDKVRVLAKYGPFAKLRLADIDEKVLADYTLHRSGGGAVSSLNRELATMRKALNLAYEWRLIQRAPKVRLLPGEASREFVVDGELETRYLALASYPLRECATIILDLGLRPEECVSLRKVDVTPNAVLIPDGKSRNAYRSIPQTDRTREVFELACAYTPDSPWIFPGRKGKHLHRTSLDNMHIKLRREEGLPTEFVLYSLRHTFGTRLAESGADPFHVMRLMGHADIRMSSRYVHPGSEDIERAMRRKELLDKAIRGHEDAPKAEKSRTSSLL